MWLEWQDAFCRCRLAQPALAADRQDWLVIGRSRPIPTCGPQTRWPAQQGYGLALVSRSSFHMSSRYRLGLSDGLPRLQHVHFLSLGNGLRPTADAQFAIDITSMDF